MASVQDEYFSGMLKNTMGIWGNINFIPTTIETKALVTA